MGAAHRGQEQRSEGNGGEKKVKDKGDPASPFPGGSAAQLVLPVTACPGASEADVILILLFPIIIWLQMQARSSISCLIHERK